jgi:hypothetical protein
MDGESENCDGTAYPLSGFDVTRKAVFFGYFLLGQQKKAPRPRGRNAFDLDPYAAAHRALYRKAKSFRLAASDFSLLVQRKVTKRKHLPRDVKIAQGWPIPSPFSDRPSMA